MKINPPRKGREHRFGGSLPNRFRLLDTGGSEFTKTETGIFRILSEGSTYRTELAVRQEYVSSRLRELYRLSCIKWVHRGFYDLAE